MDDVTKKRVQIGIMVGCLILAAVIFFATMSPGGGSKSKGARQVVLLCANPDCGAVTEMSSEEFREMLMENQDGNPMMMGMMGPQVYECLECAKKSAYIANKCEECGEVFIPDQSGDDYPDRCPECGYSKYEEARGK